MKIILLGTAHPYRGGIAALNERLGTELLREGHEMTIYNFSLQYPSFLFPGKSQYTDDPAPQDLLIIRKVNSVNPFNWLKIGRELRKKAPDLIIVRFWLPFMGPALGTICRLARKNRHTRVICIADNMIPHEHRPGDRWFTKYFIGGVDGFIAMSHEVFDDIDKFVKSPFRKFTPHPVYDHYGEIMNREEALGLLKLDDKFRYLLFFGFIRDYKGLDLLLQAMSNPILKEKKVKLIVAGEFYGKSEPYFQIIRELNLDDQVVMFNDYIPNDKINQYFCAADMIVQPYKSATQSGVTQIGYHFNKPMLVTNVGGLAEIIADRKSGYVVTPDPKEIALALADFFDNNRQADFEKETTVLKKNFSWEVMTAALMDLYHSFAK